MRIWPALLVLLIGCSGSSKSRSARDAADAQRKQLEAEKPAAPYETRERIAFRPTERCGQGPYRIETDSLHAPFGEQIIVYACGQHEISGNYRFTTTNKDGKPGVSERAFGWRRDNAACKADRATAAAAVSSGGGGGAGGGAVSSGGGSSKIGGAGGDRPTAPPATLAPTALERVEVVPEDCRSRSQLLDHTVYSQTDWAPLDAHLVIDFWSEEPNDHDGLVFVIEKRAVVADMTLERWKAYLEADRAWDERYRAFVEGEVASGHSKWVDNSVKAPPPPPARVEVQPPRPSRNARWIPGYWHYEGTQFHWIAGLWQVPEEDIAKDLTVHAPSPPPAPPVAAAEPPKEDPRPARAAVWTPGHWQWDGRAYVWIAGAWRIPPSQQHTWRPATWTIRTGGAIFVPGGWRVRIGR